MLFMGAGGGFSMWMLPSAPKRRFTSDIMSTKINRGSKNQVVLDLC